MIIIINDVLYKVTFVMGSDTSGIIFENTKEKYLVQVNYVDCVIMSIEDFFRLIKEIEISGFMSEYNI